jgi:pimeloyl-ACP methyl ester carboxylesterase
MIESIALLLAVLLVVGIIVMLTTAHLMAEAILQPPRMTDGKAVYVLKRLSPGDLGLKFSDERIPVRDSANPTGPAIELAAWWIPAEMTTSKCVVFLHGYADAKVGSIAWGPVWHSLGFNILAVDLRAHGESGGQYSTAGFFERHEINEMLDRVRTVRPDETSELVLFGLSMGAAIALAMAALRNDLTAVVIDSPFADYRTALRKHIDRLGLPSGVTAGLAIRLAQWISGANFSAVAPLKLLPDVPCPILLIRGEMEDAITSDELSSLHRAMTDRAGRLADVEWIVRDAAHLGALQANPDLYAQKIDAFIKTATAGHSPV